MPPVHDQAVCIRHWDWSETSQTVSLLTREHGLVRALAKGSRRPKSKYSGGVELLTRAEIGLIIKRNSDLALLTEWDLLETYPWLRARLGAYHAGLYMAELVQHMVSDHDPHPELFDALVVGLRALEHPDDTDRTLLNYQRTLLLHAGYTPILDRDIRTGEALGAERICAFVPELGGIALSTAEIKTAEGRVLEAWPVRSATLRALAHAENGAGITADDRHRANLLLASYMRFLIGRSPHTLGVVFPALRPK